MQRYFLDFDNILLPLKTHSYPIPQTDHEYTKEHTVADWQQMCYGISADAIDLSKKKLLLQQIIMSMFIFYINPILTIKMYKNNQIKLNTILESCINCIFIFLIKY